MTTFDDDKNSSSSSLSDCDDWISSSLGFF